MAEYPDLFEELRARYTEEVRRFFLDRGFSSAESEHLTQETFARGNRSRSLNELRGESEARNWILAIARKVYLDQLQRDRASKRRESETPHDEPPPPEGPDRLDRDLPAAPEVALDYDGGSGGMEDPPPDPDMDMPADPPPAAVVDRDWDDERSPASPDPDHAMPGESPAPTSIADGLLIRPKPSSDFTLVEVFYATDRNATASRDPARFYGSRRGEGGLRYGLCEVSIPEDHRIGHLEGPSWRRFEFRADPEKHVVLLGLTELSGERLFEDLSATLRDSQKNQILLFLHGFNVSFEDAARRTAQMAYDLKFEGAAAFYSWPSKGALAAYTHDEATVEWTIPHLKGFLEDLAARSGAEAIHLIAHSMGNRALTRALEQLAAVMADPDAPSFSEVILTAPDIDADVFRQVAAAFRRAARRVTLYASDRDRALLASHKVHGYPRAGDGGPNVVVVPGIDTVDASAVDTDLVGHFYYGDNRSVLSDVFYVLRGHSPGDRSMLRARTCPAGSYWAFVP